MSSTVVLHPARLVPIGFLGAIVVGTLLLMLPAAHVGGADPLTALFTATSAICVTGLATVDTASYWTGFGQFLILAMFQLGGLGIMTAATLLGLLVTRRLRLSSRLLAATESRSLSAGDAVSVLKLIVGTTVAVELLTAAILAARLHVGHDMHWAQAVWHGLFHAVSAFNNAGFSTWSNSLAGFRSDPWMLGPIMLAVLLGGIGFPVLAELKQQGSRPKRWSLHTRLTIAGSVLLLAFGFLATLGYEWHNPDTLAPLSFGDKVLNALFHAVMPRTAGFNSLDVGAFHPETLLVNEVLMFIGGGSAGTAGGIKVGTFVVLGLVAWAEARAEPDAAAFGRRIPREIQRQALTAVVLGLLVLGAGTLALLTTSALPFEPILFEAVSAFGTVGLSTGITAALPPSGQLVLVVLMFVGRVGTVTVVSALALRGSRALYRYPEERPIVG